MAKKDYLTAAEAAAFLGVSRTSLYAYVSRGLVSSEPAPGSKRRERRYPRRSLEQLTRRRADRREPAAGALRGVSPVLDSSITHIADGRLAYRGHDAVVLSRTATLEQVASLLWTGQLDRDLFPTSPSAPARPTPGSMSDKLVACLVEQRARHPLSIAEPTQGALRATASTIEAMFASVGATGGGTLAQRLAGGWNTDAVDAIQSALILCADHGLSTSAFTARCVASTDAPMPNALLAALCALEGRRHGGVANGEITNLLDDIDHIGATRACRRTLAQHGWLPGFKSGANPYPNGDPRATELLSLLPPSRTDAVAGTIRFAKNYDALPLIEFALVALERRAALPIGAAFAIFALGRSTGWAAHAFESAATGRLIRPTARYSGPEPEKTSAA